MHSAGILPTLSDSRSLAKLAKDIELDAVGSQFKTPPYLAYPRMYLHSDGTLVVLPGMLFPISESQTVVVIKATAKTSLGSL